MRSHEAVTDSPGLWDTVAEWAADTHTATQPRPDKKAAARFQRDRTDVNRWRNHGKGSPVETCLQYVLRCDDPMRVAATVLAAARMARLSDKTTGELIEIYRSIRPRSVDREAADSRLDVLPHAGSTWQERASAGESDASDDLTLAAIERVFAARRVSVEEVLGS